MKYEKIISKQYDLLDEIGKYEMRRSEQFSKFNYMPQIEAINHILNIYSAFPIIKIADLGCGCGSDYFTFQTLFNLRGYLGIVEWSGCDLSKRFVDKCNSRGLDAHLGNFIAHDMKRKIGKCNLVWSNMSIIHFEINEIKKAVSEICQYALPGGVIVIGFKTGEDITQIDKADATIPIDRPTTFLKIASIKNILIENKCKLLSLIEKYSSNDETKYSYAWLFSQRSS